MSGWVAGHNASMKAGTFFLIKIKYFLYKYNTRLTRYKMGWSSVRSLHKNQWNVTQIFEDILN